MATRIILALIGLVYIGLAAWCTLKPSLTSNKVGFELNGGSGQSEFVVVYGGLELAIGLFLVLPLIRPELTTSSLLLCVMMHASLVTYRTISLFVFPGIESMTYRLAIGEWIIFLVSVGLLVTHFVSSSASPPE